MDRQLAWRGRWILLLALLGGCPQRGMVMVPPDEEDGGMMMMMPMGDGGTVSGPDGGVPGAPACMPINPNPARTDPCPGRPDCGLPSHGRVDITGARTMLEEFQVAVTLPMAVRGAVGAMCDRMVFRAMDNTWAPHFVTDCAMGKVYVRVPRLAAGSTQLQLHYGGGAAVPAAQSYDDTFDRVPYRAANAIGLYTFDEGTGARTCPVVGTAPFDAYLEQSPYRQNHPQIRGAAPNLWSMESHPSLLAPTNPEARFRRRQFSLNFPTATVLPNLDMPAKTITGRPVNWRSPSGAPFNTARMQLTVGVWTRPESPSNFFNDNFQTVVCFGMPNPMTRAAHWRMAESAQGIINNSIYNPWAIFFRGDGVDDTLYQGNTCVSPCLDVINYAHITTTTPLAGAAFVRNWHFLAFTFDATTRPHTTRRSYYDTQEYSYPETLELFPQDRQYCPNPLSFAGCNPDPGERINCAVPCAPLCPGGRGPCIFPPEAPIEYPPAPLIIGADMNDGYTNLGMHGQIDDMFILARGAGVEEIRAYREHRQYSPDPIVATVTP